MTPLSPSAEAPGTAADVGPTRVVRIAMRSGTVTTLENARLYLRNDTLQAVFTTSVRGAPISSIAVPMAGVASVQTRRLSTDRSIGAFLLFTGAFVAMMSLLPPGLGL